MLIEKKKSIGQVLMLSGGMMLASATNAEGLVTDKLNEAMEGTGLYVDGWVSIGGAYNPDEPADKFNGPVTFNDRANEFNMHQLYGVFGRDVNTEGDSWDIGFRFDVIYGTDARFTTQANYDDNLVTDGASRFYKLAFPQAYVDIFAPIGNGLTATIGHFYTIIGNEVVTAPDNFFFSHAYTMQYGEPFTHTGILLKYPLNDNVGLTGGVVSGWDSFFQEPANFLGGINFASDDESTSLALSITTGEAGRFDRHSNRTMYSVVFNNDFTENLHYTFHHDFGIQENGAGEGKDANWYGVNQYLVYDLADTLSVGIRGEWFRDEDGTRVTDFSNSYFAVTGGINWSPVPWLTVRPEVRYDMATSNDVYETNQDDDQFTVSADMIVHF